MAEAICGYGCGKPSKHTLGNGRFCCEQRFTLCEAYRKRAALRQTGTGNSFYGKQHSAEVRREMSESRLGEANAFYGKRHTEATKAIVSRSRSGQCCGSDNPTFGKVRPESVKRAISETRIQKGIAKGRSNPNWRHGQCKLRQRDMSTAKYKLWRQSVLLRDDFTCCFCHKRGGDLEVDHIKPWAFFPELRHDPANGRVLCVTCHRKTFKEVFKWRDISR